MKNNPSCPSCTRKMTAALLEKQYHDGVKSSQAASVWLCDPSMGGCGTQIPRTLGRKG